MGRAQEVVREGPRGEVPPHLRSGATSGDRDLGFGVGYRYPHDDPRGVVPQQYLPDGMEDTTMFTARPIGDERELAERLERIDEILGKGRP